MWEFGRSDGGINAKLDMYLAAPVICANQRSFGAKGLSRGLMEASFH